MNAPHGRAPACGVLHLEQEGHDHNEKGWVCMFLNWQVQKPNCKVDGAPKKVGGNAGRHFACEIIGSELIMLGCETAGIIRGVPILPSETASSGGCRGASKNCVARSGAVGSSEMNRQSEFPIEETSSSVSTGNCTDFSILKR